jgi:UrcA family protein
MEKKMISNKTKMTWALAMATVAASAYASSDELPTRRVSYRDLDLSQRDGALTLYRRIDLAADAVCEPLSAWQKFLAEQIRSCHEQALAHAVADVNAPALTEVYAAKTR